MNCSQECLKLHNWIIKSEPKGYRFGFVGETLFVFGIDLKEMPNTGVDFSDSVLHCPSPFLNKNPY